jgi:hypothetical protein
VSPRHGEAGPRGPRLSTRGRCRSS